MSSSHGRSLLILAGLVLTGTVGMCPPSSAGVARWFGGEVVVLDAERFRAPEPVSDLGGWRGSTRTVELLRVAADGEQVTSGDELAVFSFPEADLKRGIEWKIRTARAEREKNLAFLSDRLRDLEAKADQARLEVRRAELELKKRGVLSRRDFKLVQLARRRAAFEVEAVDKQIRAQRDVIQAVRAFQDERVRQAERMGPELLEFRKRFSIRAPNPGMVVLPRLPDQHRPVQPGDRLTPGVPFLSLSPGGRLAVEFLVPETELGDLHEGWAVSIQALHGGGKVDGKITRIHPFPVRSGRPAGAGLDSRVRVTAELPTGVSGFRPGQPVKVAL